MREIDEWRLLLVQEKLIRKARQLYIPIPRKDSDKFELEQEDDNWYYSNVSGEVLLKNEAMVNLRREVRREQKEKWDF